MSRADVATCAQLLQLMPSIRWPGLIYVRARPTWIRWSDYICDPPEIVEYDREQLEK